MLHAHPRIAIPPETRILVQAYLKRRRFGDLRNPERRREMAQWVTGATAPSSPTSASTRTSSSSAP